MAGTTKPLNILVDSILFATDEVLDLVAKGHNVTIIPTDKEYDLILGPNCWRMHKGLLKYLDVAIKGARQLRYADQTTLEQKAKPSRKAVVHRKPRAKGKASAVTTSGDTNCPSGESSQLADH